MKCTTIQRRIPAYVGEAEPTRRERRHLAKCRECAAELTRYESLARSLGDLRAYIVEPPPGLEASLVAIPAQDRRRSLLGHVFRNRRLYAGGLALALTAGTARWMSRRPATA